MISHPLISVIIPVYNNEKYIKKALDSVFEDNYPNKEIVLIDDGSTDNSNQVIIDWIEKYKNAIPVTYKSRENRGISKTLNEIIEMCQGEYYARLDSDDYLLSDDSLMSRLEYLENNPQKLGVLGDCIIVDSDDNTLYESGLFEYRRHKKQNFMSDEGLKKELLTKFALPGPILMMHHSIFEYVGKYNEEVILDDLDFYLTAIQKDLIGYLDKKVCAYRIHGLNMSTKNSQRYLKLLQDSKKIYMKQLGLYDKKYAWLIIKQIIKFQIRIFLFQYKHFSSSKTQK